MRVLIVANRLPVTIERRPEGYRFVKSAGGVATGLDSVSAIDERLWIGWAEGVTSRVDASDRDSIRAKLREQYHSEPVFLTNDDVADFLPRVLEPDALAALPLLRADCRVRPEMVACYERVEPQVSTRSLMRIDPVIASGFMTTS
jgi:hypothetical protein